MPETGMRLMPAWVNWGRKLIRLLPRGRYPLMKSLCRWQVEPFNAPLGMTQGRLHFACDLSDGIAREACFMGYYEPQETALVRALLRPGMTFVDIGANWGYYTLLAADLVGPRGCVVACEPHPALFRLLESNVTANRLSWVAPLRIAVADREDEMNLAGFDERGENSGVSRLTDNPDPSVPNFRVPTQRLEIILEQQGVGEIDLLKMDIEGGEGVVLPTLAGALARGRFRHILLELHPTALREQDIAPRELVEMILDYGYGAWRLDHSAAASRRAAYKFPSSPKQFMMPFDMQSALDDWPHVLFVAPGIAPSW